MSLLAQGGIEMCGGRDFDRELRDNVVLPWLTDSFNLPQDFAGNEKFRPLVRLAEWAVEQAKIELSKRDHAIIAMDESELGVKDLDGKDVYLDITIERSRLDDLIASKVEKSVQAARETIAKAGINPHDVERIVFIGGPTQYKPLRDKVAFELGIAASTEVKPMTAVAEGAAVFAKSVDWSSRSRGRKRSRRSVSVGGRLDLSVNYISRTPDDKARIAVKLGTPLPGIELQVDSLDTGWSSGRIALKDGETVEVPLPKRGENSFKLFVFKAEGGPAALENDRFTITRTAATVEAIPASHSVGIEALSRTGGKPGLVYIVREGEQLPKKGKEVFKAETSLRAGSPGSLKFKVWEGEIEDPINDNRFVGRFEIKGSHFEEGVIAAGADLICEYEVLDSRQHLPRSDGAVDRRNVPERKEFLFPPGGSGRSIASFGTGCR